jgi:hypothetical protein
MTHRLFLTGLALGPAVALAVGPAAPALLPIALVLTIAGSTYALYYALKDATVRFPATSLVRPEVLLDHRLGLPDPDVMRGQLRGTLGTEEALTNLSSPPDKHQSVAIAVRRVMQVRGHDAVERLSKHEVTELYLLRDLLLADADKAGALAEAFHRPDMILGIRDEVARMAKRRALYEEQQAIFEATQKLWHSVQRAGGPDGLLLSLQRLAIPDPDLWHKVVLEHDPTCPEQRAAALWCVRQRSCDRATVAAFLAFAAMDDRLIAAGRSGDRIWLDAVLDVIDAWNSGVYKSQKIALSHRIWSWVRPQGFRRRWTGWRG